MRPSAGTGSGLSPAGEARPGWMIRASPSGGSHTQGKGGGTSQLMPSKNPGLPSPLLPHPEIRLTTEDRAERGGPPGTAPGTEPTLSTRLEDVPQGSGVGDWEGPGTQAPRRGRRAGNRRQVRRDRVRRGGGFVPGTLYRETPAGRASPPASPHLARPSPDCVGRGVCLPESRGPRWGEWDSRPVCAALPYLGAPPQGTGD